MNQSKSKLTNIFVIQTIILLILILSLVIRELIKYGELSKLENDLRNTELLTLNTIDTQTLREYEERYQMFIGKLNKENSLGELLKFIEEKTIQYNITIRESRILSVTDNEIIYELNLEGEINSIYLLVKAIEEDINIKEIQKTEIKMINKSPNMRITIKAVKL